MSIKCISDFWNRWRPLRFLIVGAWNTVFSYSVFALLYHWFGGGWRDVPVQVVAAVVGISNAYVCHRMLTFHSHGTWWREYVRFWIVYGGQTLLQMAMFLVFSTWLGFNGYVVQLVLVALFTALSYWAHGHYSFRPS